jgi:hypothetical protein
MNAKYYRIPLVLLVLLALLAGMLPTVLATTGDEIRAAKKIISVAYDDSGSMKGNRWVNASYAMQALTALLNEQDTLHMTYMSDPGVAVTKDLSDLQSTVNGIRDWKHSSGTPGETLDTAYRQLVNTTESDRSAQFWLVIMTDGEISMPETIQEKLNSFKGSKMSNGSTINVVYLSMGGSNLQAFPDTRNGLYTFHAADASAITQAMSEIANLISGRLPAEHVQQVDDTTIRFSGKLPLYSISVLSQQSSASVVSAEVDGQSLRTDRNISLSAHDPYKEVKTKLFGNAAVIDAADGSGNSTVIPAGTYTITFSEPVDLKELVIQYEPAIEMKLVITRNGLEVTDPSKLKPGDKITVEVIPMVPGTNQEIPAGDLPDKLTWNLQYEVNGSVENAKDSTRLTGITLQEGDNVIRSTLNIPGFAPSIRELQFDIVKIVYHFGIEVDQPDPLSYLRGKLSERTGDGDVTFRITNDGIPLTKEEQKEIGVKLKITDTTCDNSAVEGYFNWLGQGLVDCKLTQNDDGSYTLTPQSFLPVAFLIMAGDYTVTVALNQDDTITATGRFTLVPHPSDFIDILWLILIIFGLMYLIFILFLKRKFTNRTVRCDIYQLQSSGGGVLQNNQSKSITVTPLTGLFSLERASTVKFKDVTLKAGEDGEIYITEKSIAKNMRFFGTSASNPITSLRSIVNSLQPTQQNLGGKIERSAVDMPLGASPVYLRKNATDKNILAIYIPNGH